MLKLFAIFMALWGVASAGYLGGGYGFTAPSYAYHAAPAVVAAPTVLKTYSAPTYSVAAAPVVKTYAAPAATSYSNFHKISTSVPVVHAAPAVVHAAPTVVHAAPTVVAAAPTIYKSYAAPAVLSAPAYSYGYGHGYPSFYHH